MFSKIYSETAERLWEKLEFYRDDIDANVDFTKPFPIDQLTALNPFVQRLIDEVQEEYGGYLMSEFQCSWATNQFVREFPLSEYNEFNGTKLESRK